MGLGSIWPQIAGFCLAFSVLAFPQQRGSSADYSRAQAAVMQSAWDQAIVLLQGILKANPRDLKAINLMGLALTGKGDTHQANQLFERALRIDPNFYPARKNLAINLLHLKQLSAAERNLELVLNFVPNDPLSNAYLGQLAFARKDYAVAVKHLKQSGPWLENDSRLVVMAADCEFHLGHHDAAIRLLNQLALDKLDPAWQFRAGYLLAAHEQFADAIRFFEAVRRRYPESYDIAFNLAFCYIQIRRFDPAITLLNEFRDHQHKTSELDNLLAQAYEGDGQTQRATDLLREAAALAPKEERNYEDLAMLCADHSSFELALEIVNIGLHYIPNSDALLLQRGIIYAMSGKYDLAEQDFQRAERSDAEKDAALVALGLAYIEQGDDVYAASMLRDRVRQEPNNAALQYLYAEALIRAGARVGDSEFAAARAALERSVSLNPQFVYSRVDLAKLYLQEAKIDQAVRQLKAALRIDPTKVQIYAQLGVALRREGRRQEADTMFTKVRELNDYNRKHGELPPLVKLAPAQLADSPGTVR
jgi:predicted Zn-dependent protease